MTTAPSVDDKPCLCMNDMECSLIEKSLLSSKGGNIGIGNIVYTLQVL